MILGYPWLHTFNPDIDWPSCKLIGPTVKIETLFHGHYPSFCKALKKKWGITPTQEKADQIDLVVRQPEVTEPEPLSEEDLIVQEAIEVVITESLDVEANPANGETFIEAREAVIKEQNPKLHLDEPEPEKPLKEIIPQWCHEYLDFFTEKEAIDLPPHRPWDHHVNLTPDAPPSISCCTYPLSRTEEELDAGLIRELKSPYATPVFYIKKKNGSFHPIFDYWKINAIMVKDTFPLLCINMIIEGARNKVKFSVLDLCNRYWNVQNSEVLEDILTFKTTRGLYSLLVMPFGPTNTP